MLTAGFLPYFLLSPEGLQQIGFASPGTADRNRTLSLTNLVMIEVPLPPIATQRIFDALQAKVAALKTRHATIRQANDALIPATLERLFSGAD
jgi:type I restriction enzyme S subunit